MACKSLYIPPPALRTKIDDFRDYVNNHYNLYLDSYQDLHGFSIERLNDFWMSVWSFAGSRRLTDPYAVDENMCIDRLPPFFQEARLNFAENLLCGDDDELAVISINEENLHNPQKNTWKELRQLAGRYANALRELKLGKGEVVALIGSNCARSLAFFLATAAVGGIFASFATDIGDKALGDRLSQLQPRIIIAESSYWYNGKLIDISAKITKCVNGSDDSRESRLVIIGSTSKIRQKCMTLEDFEATPKRTAIEYEQVSFNTPLVVMFSSGTTGVPKGIVHSHGGLILNGFKEHLLHNSFGPHDMYFHFSNIGWTLWNISFGAMFCKTAMVLYDGSPFYPTPAGFLEAVLSTGITAFGAGPRYYSELQRRNLKPRQMPNKLHSLYSTGAVLTPGLACWIAEAFGPLCQISFSGGTELCGSFLHGTRSLPTYPGEIAVKELGMDVDVFSPEGLPLPDGESGELVCKRPFPNMPVAFWNDPEGTRYKKSYFSMFPHVWTHGDLIRVNPDTKGIYVLGRSDGVLNPSGIRFGSSEIYNILATPQFDDLILDALVVGQQRISPRYSDPTERVLLFIKCSSSNGDLFPPAALDKRIRQQIAIDLSRRHVPEYIFEVPEIPYNVNGKKMEIQVKAVVNAGVAALARMKVSPLERAMLEQFAKFHDVETLVKKDGKNRMAKL